MRKAILALVALAVTASTAPAQGWAEKMFKDGSSHDFGSVPRGAQLFHRFTITNIYAVRMEITAVKSGCGCVSATAAKRVLEPRESTTIDVNMDARRFTGPKTVAVRLRDGVLRTLRAETIVINAGCRPSIPAIPGILSTSSLSGPIDLMVRTWLRKSSSVNSPCSMRIASCSACF